MSENEKMEQAELEAALEAEAAESVEKVEKSKPAKSDDKKDKGDDKKSKKPSIFKRIAKWFKEMKSELKKVQWPGWKSTLKSTGIVIVCVLIVGAFIWVFDALAHSIINALIALFRG